jgi:hypothetical protein
LRDPDETKRFKFDWQRKVLACRLGSATTAVALAISVPTDKRGGNAHPGVRLLAHQTELGESTVRRCLEHLRELGLLKRTMQGSRAEHRNFADVYELAIPDDLGDRVDVVEKPAEMTRAPNRGGKANHVRWHEKRSVTDPKCSYCAETPGVLASPRESLARVTGGIPEEFAKPSPDIRPALGRIPTSARTEGDHRSVEEHQQSCTNTTVNHHAASPVAGPRASSRAPDDRYKTFVAEELWTRVQPGEKLTAEDEEELFSAIDYDYVIHVVGELDAVEESTVLGMLNNIHPCAVVNKILDERSKAA